MSSSDELKTTIRRNLLLGAWAAQELGLAGADAESYAKALAADTIDPDRNDVFSRIRKDFDAAGVNQSDEQILDVMSRLMIEAGEMSPTGGGVGSDKAALMLARKLTTR